MTQKQTKTDVTTTSDNPLGAKIKRKITGFLGISIRIIGILQRITFPSFSNHMGFPSCYMILDTKFFFVVLNVNFRSIFLAIIKFLNLDFNYHGVIEYKLK